jgi:putative protease
MKSADYVGAVVCAYRLVLDAIAKGGEEEIRRSIAEGQKILQGDFARSKTTYFFTTEDTEFHGGRIEYVSGTPCTPWLINWLNPAQDGGTGISLGVIVSTQGRADERRALVSGDDSSPDGLGVQPAVGDSIRLHRSDDSERVSHKLKYAEATPDGFWLSIPGGFGKGDRVYLIQTRALSKRHKPIIAHNEKAGGREPGFDTAPFPAIVPKTAAKHRGESAAFPDGLYVAVSSINDLYIVQSSRPAKVMLSLTHKTARALLEEGNKPLPFKPADMMLILNPFFPQADSEELAEIIRPLADRGYRQFVVNNLGHISLFRDIRADVQLVAGPWLYTFNAWALAYIVSLGVDGFIPPLENNRQNWEKTLGAEGRTLRSMAFVPVFAWPPLFHIRADLAPLYDFKRFGDNRDEQFSLIADREGSMVIPEKPFSITDKIPFLQEAGFRRFVIDLSGPPLKKNVYKDLMRAAHDGTLLPRISRFNWKNGFYTETKTSPAQEHRS